MMKKSVLQRFVIFLLASLSFACLLGEFYGLWKMQLFACFVLLPATLMLIAIAVRRTKVLSETREWIIEGALGGLVAALAYDLFRLPFVLAGFPLFGVFPRFGQMLLDRPPDDFGLAVQLAGWTYHFSNGAALGIMLLAMLPARARKYFLPASVAWALGVEAMLLVTPYYSFFNLKMPQGVFIALTLSAHVVFGLALGWWLRFRFAQRALTTP